MSRRDKLVVEVPDVVESLAADAKAIGRNAQRLAIRVRRAELEKSLTAWAKWYSARLDRISKGSKEDYTGYEQDLFEAIGCFTGDTDLSSIVSEERERCAKIARSRDGRIHIGASTAQAIALEIEGVDAFE